MMDNSVLLVEDDSTLNEALSETLQTAGYRVVSTNNGIDALKILKSNSVSVLLSDIQMHPMNGRDLLNKVRHSYPDLPVLLMTAYGEIDQAVDAMKQGASDYLVKPFTADYLLSIVDSFYPKPIDHDSMIAVDSHTQAVVQLARRVAISDATVMLTGESGVGKEVFARLIHKHSPRNAGPFVAINCAAIPENMLEATLFGYEKGSFTGAYESRAGKFEMAAMGTLLLDEISEMALPLQAKLLRVLQERECERIGGKRSISLDVRIVATTNRNLLKQVKCQKFREDLYYRLNVFPLHVPPLRERKEDIIPLCECVLSRLQSKGKSIKRLSPHAVQSLLLHPWPGNVRELENVMQRAVIFQMGEVIGSDDLCYEDEFDYSLDDESDANDSKKLSDLMKDNESKLIVDTLNAHKGKRKDAASALGISARTLRYKLARLREQGVELPC